MANTLNFEKAVKEVLSGVISISYGKEGKMNTAYVCTKNIIAADKDSLIWNNIAGDVYSSIPRSFLTVAGMRFGRTWLRMT